MAELFRDAGKSTKEDAKRFNAEEERRASGLPGLPTSEQLLKRIEILEEAVTNLKAQLGII